MHAEDTNADPKSGRQPDILQADDLKILVGTQQVFRDGTEIPLSRLTFDLLMALVRAAPNTVSHEDLLREVWPGLVVSPETVTQRVKLLREALGDDSQAPRYIGGVRGRGYRLLAPVRGEAAARAARPRQRRFGLLALIAAAAAVAAAAVYLGLEAPDAADPEAPPSGRASIAVLPFATVSPDAAEQDYFAAGIHDDLLTRLAQIDGLDVISRGSVLQYRDSRKPLSEIGRELGVATLLEGSVQQVKERVRINVQLIDAITDTHLWAQVYDRELTVANLLDIQADIAQTIAGELRVELQPRLVESMVASTTSNLEAYRLYLAANEYRYRWFDEGVRDLLLVAEDFYRRAIALDPSFALAHAALGRLLAEIYWQQARPPSTALIGQVRDEAERALALAPGLAEAHLALASYHYYGFLDYVAALSEVALAEQAMPGNADVYLLKSLILRRLGRLDECVAAAQRLVDLAPHGRGEALLLAGFLVRQGRLEDASAVHFRLLERAPDDVAALAGLANIDFLRTGQIGQLRSLAKQSVGVDPNLAWRVGWITGDYDLALAAIGEMPQDDNLSGDTPPVELLRGLTEQAAGNGAGARAGLLRLRGALEAQVARQGAVKVHNALMALALVQAALGEHDEAVAAGRRAVELVPLEKDRFEGALLQVELAMVYAQAGAVDRALDALELGLDEPFAPLPLLWQWDPRLAVLRSHPRFESLVARYGAGGERWQGAAATSPAW